MLTMYDSDNPDSIPDDVFAAGYVDGYAASAWNARGWSRFPNARRIAVFASTNAGNVGDVERGDMLPWELPDWIQMRRAAGEIDPWGYVNLSNWAATQTEFRLRGIPEPNWWVADYDGVIGIPPGAIAKQYADPAIIPGNPHYDLSVVVEAFGPGGGTIGVEMLDSNDPVVQQIYADLARLMSDLTSVKINVTDIYFALGLPQPNPTDPTTAKSPALANLAAAIADLKASLVASGGTEPPEPTEPTKITLNIPSVPGTATGTIS